MQIEMPARVANLKPFCSKRSANTTVSFKPHFLNDVLIKREISFFFKALFKLLNGNPLGKISDKRARPAVVSTIVVWGTNSPLSLSLVHSVRRTLILAVNSTTLASKARWISPILAKIMPSPLALMRSRVV